MAAQSHHRHRTLERRGSQAAVWQAYLGQASGSGFAYRGLRATEDALWRKTDPFAFYRHKAGTKRDPDPGPHAEFMKLAEMSATADPRLHHAMDVFATRYGLLGHFHLRYSAPVLPAVRYSALVLPEDKVLISPEAVVEEGRLRCVDPHTEGLELLTRARHENPLSSWQFPAGNVEHFVAMPEEVGFAARALWWPHQGLSPAGYVPWTVARWPYDALFVLDLSHYWNTGVSVLV